jgi:hypothetical protein
MDLVLSLDLQPMHLVAWQAFWVGLFCRMLHSLSTGAVHSKKASMAWAIGALDPAWRGLIERAAAVRKGDAVQSGQPAATAEVEATHAFARYAAAYADKAARAREILERRLAEKRGTGDGFQPGRSGGPPTAGRRSSSGPFVPSPIRPGQRGRRG